MTGNHLIPGQQILVDELLAQYEPIALAAMEAGTLMNRVDTKFTFSRNHLAGLLDRVLPNYRLLTVNGVQSQHYETLYFDTAALGLYYRHHNGVYPRHKVRFRSYLDSRLCFFEVKVKNNKGRTTKHRIGRPGVNGGVEGEAWDLLQRTASFVHSEVQPVLWVHFTRLTFVHKHLPERLTIDLDLSYRTDGTCLRMPGLVIAEVKRDHSRTPSAFIHAMRERRLWEGSMSKYCFGIISLYPEARKNRFKERLKEIHDLCA